LSSDTIHQLATVLVERAGEAIVAMDSDLRILGWNPAAERMYGWTHDEALGENGRVLLQADFGDSPFEEVLTSLDRWGRWEGVIRHRHKDGSKLWVQALVVDLGGGRIGCFNRDISERIQLEALQRRAQRIEALRSLSGGVAHAFNNLLQVIRGTTSLMMRRLPQERAGLRRIEDASERARLLVRELLDFSEGRPGSLGSLDLGRVVRGELPLLRSVLGLDTELSLDLSESWALADRESLQQGLAALCLQARESGARQVSLRIGQRSLDEDSARLSLGAQAGRYRVLEFAHDGRGMDEKRAAHCFEPSLPTHGPVAVGLGLSRVYTACSQAGGFVTLETSPETGCRFTLHLPEAEPGDTEDPPAPAGQRRGRRVLVVDDDPLVLEVTARMLSRLDFQVSTAEGPIEALAHSGPLDLLLTDVLMPGMLGTELADRMKPQHPGLAVVYMSGYVDHPDVRARLARGEVFLEKPFRIAGLRKALEHALQE
jgi:two-component system cell cycle sensor histidine kinase/response regulator CckA